MWPLVLLIPRSRVRDPNGPPEYAQVNHCSVGWPALSLPSYVTHSFTCFILLSTKEAPRGQTRGGAGGQLWQCPYHHFTSACGRKFVACGLHADVSRPHMGCPTSRACHTIPFWYHCRRENAAGGVPSVAPAMLQDFNPHTPQRPVVKHVLVSAVLWFHRFK